MLISLTYAFNIVQYTLSHIVEHGKLDSLATPNNIVLPGHIKSSTLLHPHYVICTESCLNQSDSVNSKLDLELSVGVLSTFIAEESSLEKRSHVMRFKTIQ